jgi:glutamine---fructose-6-phosphate transaminase (isomerizing)
MRRCDICLLSGTYPFISFDLNGTCNCCRYSLDYAYMGGKALNEAITKMKSKGRDYDCLIGLSGGRDSSYLALRAIKEWNLRPLVYHYDNGHVPEMTKENVKNLSKRLDIKTIVFDTDAKRNRDLFKRIFNSWIKYPHLGMIQTFCIGCRSGINKYIPQLLHKYNVSWILDGANYYEGGSYKLGLFGINGYDVDVFRGGYKKLHLQLVWALFNEFLKNPSYITPAIVFHGVNDFVKGFGANIDKTHPFFYEKYNEAKVMDAITGELDWRQPSYFPDPWRSDCDIALIKNYLYFKMTGFSDYDVFLSNMIRDNAIDRNVADKRLQQINYHLNNSTSKIKELLTSYRINSESVQLLETLLKG